MRDTEFRQRADRINENARSGFVRIHGNLPAGLILLAVGGVLLARQFGVPFPDWVFTWEALLITIGLFVGVKNRFQNFGWLILVGIGVFFMMDDFYPDIRNFIWPVVIIIIGLFIILKPPPQKKELITDEVVANKPMPIKDDVLDVTSVFGSTGRIVLSKDFKGGEVVSVFGGSEINLLQADFTSPIKIEVVAIFGGVKLVIPSNWEIRSETAAVMGGIDDRREHVQMANPEKIVILEGTAIFGGIEISSF